MRQRCDVTLALRQGRTADELAALARELHAGAIVVATRAPGPVSAAVRGSLGQELTTRAATAVVVVPSFTD